MNGIWGSNILLTIYFVVFFVYSTVATLISPLLTNKKGVSEKSITANVSTNNPSRIQKISNILSPFLAVIILLVIFFAAFIYKIKAVIWLILFLGYAFPLCILPYAIVSFIYSIFVKPFKSSSTKVNQVDINFIGLMCLFFCATFQKTDIHELSNQYPILNFLPLQDFLQFVGLFIWFFSMFFFIPTFGILTLINLKNCFTKESKSFPNKLPLQYTEGSLNFHNLLEEKLIKNESLLTSKKYFLAIYYMIILVWSILKSFILLGEIILDLIRKIFFIIVNSIFWGILKIKEKINSFSEKTIIILSQISLIASLGAIFAIDKYQNIFSDVGSEIYEFICSVLLIPFLITKFEKIKGYLKKY